MRIPDLCGAAALIGVALLSACDAPTDTDAGPATISLSPPALQLAPGTSHEIAATVLDRNGTALDVAVTWSSDDPAIATTSDAGLVLAMDVGTTHVTAAAGDVSASATVQVVQPLGLQWPLPGVENQDYILLNYVDHGGPGDIEDYHCGLKSYDGHQGIDIALKSFAQMDTGVAILAAAAGVVAEVHDGEFDRNTSWDNGGGFANHVALQHDGGWYTYYGHMRKNSVAVALGDAVQAGDTLGLVGSSGTSDLPHLHLEMRQGQTTVVDPYTGDCGPTMSHWADQPVYQDDFRLLDAGTTIQTMDLTLAKQPPPPADTIPTTADRVYAWVELHNVPRGSSSSFRFIAPGGSTFATVTINHDTFYSLSWWWAWHGVQGEMTAGTWQVEYANNGQTLATTSFVLVNASAPAPAARTPGAPVSGHGGGGLRTPRTGAY